MEVEMGREGKKEMGEVGGLLLKCEVEVVVNVSKFFCSGCLKWLMYMK